MKVVDAKISMPHRETASKGRPAARLLPPQGEAAKRLRGEPSLRRDVLLANDGAQGFHILLDAVAQPFGRAAHGLPALHG